MDNNLNDFFYEFLQGFPGLTEEDKRFIADNSTVELFKKGTKILSKGQISRNCYSVLKGCVRQYSLVEGEERTTAFFTEGQPVVSFTSYTEEIPADHYWEVTEDTILTVGNKEHEAWMCEQVPNLGKIIHSEVERNSGKAQQEFTSFMLSTPEERYMEIMNNRPDLLNRVPQHQIASYIGVKPESLSRIRKRMVNRPV